MFIFILRISVNNEMLLPCKIERVFLSRIHTLFLPSTAKRENNNQIQQK